MDTTARYHKSQEFCHACHDVSNPILQNLVAGLGTSAGTEQFAAASFFHVERTSSEFLLSAYGRGAGTATNAGFPGVAWAAKCQDCHMRDVSGRAANKNDVPVRSDLALHDLTGGNTWITGILASADSNYAAGYDAYNYRILSGQKYPGASIDVSGISGSGAALARGQRRALEQLEMAATLSEVSETASNVTVRITNNTGHKLISGFPEGRRMFLSVVWYDAAGAVIGATNPYEPLVINRDGAGNASLCERRYTVRPGRRAHLRDEDVVEHHRTILDFPLRPRRRPLQGQPHPAEGLRHLQRSASASPNLVGAGLTRTTTSARPNTPAATTT
jgi:hypothetical protein